MKTNKPEVVAWIWDYRGRHMATTDYNQALELAEPPYPTEVEPLIRLADYQRLQADHERLQAELELWKAKIDAMAEHEVAAYQLIGIPASVGISEPVEGFAKRPQDIMPAVRDMALRIELLENQLAESEALLAESRANDRQAMAYLAAVREVVGGDDFPDMVERVAKLQAECEKLMSALKRISYQASGHECRQTPTSDLQRAFADLMRQADDALYCFYNNGLPKQRFCEYAGCCEPAVEEALCLAHLEDWREQQAIDAAMEGGKP